ncbi:MAG: NADH-quinone oxidoreductase subunit L [Williamsia sp.]|nr:NADH-quinone oxidoreductase subunit L [Williamsia sp.]
MSNNLQLVWLVPLLPFLGFLITGLGRNSLSKGATGLVGCGSILLSFVISILLFLSVNAGHTGVVNGFDFISYDKVSIPFSFQVDQLSSLFLLIITGVGFLIHVYSTSYMHGEESPHYARYFSYLNLFVFSMLLLVLGSNYLVMFIGWEGVGLCSYLLIGFWFKNNAYNYAARKAFVMNRIGDLAFLIALFWIISKAGSLNYAAVFSHASAFTQKDLTIITLLLFVGATGKSAQIPLYTWLPDAMAGPTPVSALIHAATMVTAGIYMIARSNLLYTMAPATQWVIAITGLATVILAATIALKQNDIKKVLAYSTVSQLGYMFLALGAGAYTGAVFHVMTHAFFKALLFLGAGSVIHAMHNEQDIRFMGGLKKYMPVTHITFLLGCLAIAGIPPFSGFFSKDEILVGAYAFHPVLYYIGVAGAFMTAFYMFRLYATTFQGAFRGTHEQEHHLHESPAPITVPLIVLAILSTIAGFAGIPALFAEGAHALAHFLEPIFAPSERVHPAHELSHQTEWMLLAGSLVVAVAGAAIAYIRYSKTPDLKEAEGVGKVLENKWYVDELYDNTVVRPLNALGRFSNSVVERLGIDWIVNGVGKTVQYGSRQLRFLQSGQVGNYILLMVVGILLFFAIELFFKK